MKTYSSTHNSSTTISKGAFVPAASSCCCSVQLSYQLVGIKMNCDGSHQGQAAPAAAARAVHNSARAIHRAFPELLRTFSNILEDSRTSLEDLLAQVSALSSPPSRSNWSPRSREDLLPLLFHACEDLLCPRFSPFPRTPRSLRGLRPFRSGGM